MIKSKAAFFDRDGTIIKDVCYLSNLDDVELIPGIIDICTYLQDNNYMLFVVTNQSGIGRGYFNEKFVISTHKFLSEVFAKKGVFFKKFYYCPHLPNQNCLCRKPSPGMLVQAAREYDIDLSKSLMFGDKKSDFLAGEAAGCKSFYIEDIVYKKDFLL